MVEVDSNMLSMRGTALCSVVCDRYLVKAEMTTFWLMCVDDADDAGIRTNLGSYNQYQTSAAGTT